MSKRATILCFALLAACESSPTVEASEACGDGAAAWCEALERCRGPLDCRAIAADYADLCCEGNDCEGGVVYADELADCTATLEEAACVDEWPELPAECGWMFPE